MKATQNAIKRLNATNKISDLQTSDINLLLSHPVHHKTILQKLEDANVNCKYAVILTFQINLRKHISSKDIIEAFRNCPSSEINAAEENIEDFRLHLLKDLPFKSHFTPEDNKKPPTPKFGDLNYALTKCTPSQINWEAPLIKVIIKTAFFYSIDHITENFPNSTSEYLLFQDILKETFLKKVHKCKKAFPSCNKYLIELLLSEKYFNKDCITAQDLVSLRALIRILPPDKETEKIYNNLIKRVVLLSIVLPGDQKNKY